MFISTIQRVITVSLSYPAGRIRRAKRLLWITSVCGKIARRKNTDERIMLERLAKALGDVSLDNGASLVFPLRISGTLLPEQGELQNELYTLADLTNPLDQEIHAKKVVQATPRWLHYSNQSVMAHDLLKAMFPCGCSIYA